MIRALLRRGLHHHRGLLASLCVGTLLFEMMLVWFAVEFESEGGIRQLMQLLPEAFRRLMATQMELASFAGMVGFGFQHPFILVCTVALMTVLATVPAAERESGWLDLVLSRPLTRVRYIVATIVAVVVAAVTLPLMLLAGVALALALMDVPEQVSWTDYLPSALALISLQLGVGGYTLLLAAGAKRRGTAVARATGLTLAFFVLDVFADIWDPLASVSWLSPFHYYDPMRAAVLGTAPAWHPLLLLGVFVVTAAGATLRFRRQDL